MSNKTFSELRSVDPTERAIAQRVVGILNNPGLDRSERERLVRRAQRELLEHRTGRRHQAAMLQQAQRLKLPEGYQRTTVQMNGDRVEVGGLCRRRGFAWFDAGCVQPIAEI